MRRKRRPVLFICVCLMAFASCRKAEAPEYRGFENAKLSAVNAQQSILSTDLKFYNPNHYALQLKKAEMDILLNDKPANHYLLDSTIHIPARDTFSVPVSLQLNVSSLFGNAIQIMLSKQVKLTLNGKVKLKKGAFPFSAPFHYEENLKIDSLLQSF